MDCIYYIHLLNTKQPTIATFKRNDTIRFSKILKKNLPVDGAGYRPMGSGTPELSLGLIGQIP